jgi:hypothetical protein
MESGDQSLDEPLLRSLGIQWKPSQEGGPPVDEDQLRQFVDGSLGPNTMQEVTSYVSSFRAWYDALCRMLAERKPQ